MAAADLIIEKRKWDGTVSARWPARLLRGDGPVEWWTPAGTVRAHPARGEDEVLADHERAASAGLGWITTAVLRVDGTLLRYEVDATAGGERVSGGRFPFIDLDLDLELEGDEVEVQDLAEFARNRRELAYPDEVMRTALHALEDALERAGAHRWPFDGSLARLPDGA